MDEVFDPKTAALAKHDWVSRERDRFAAAYERKLNEHSATLDQAMQLCKERDEALRWKPLAMSQADQLAAKDQMYAEMEEAHVKAYREAIAERAALTAHVAALRAALEGAFKELKAMFPNDTYLPAERALAATPQQSLAALRKEAALDALQNIAKWGREYAIKQIEEERARRQRPSCSPSGESGRA